MKRKWKMVLWSSLGSVAVGLAVALAGKSRKRAGVKLSCRKIPGDCARVSVWTERHEVEDGRDVRAAHDRYSLERTPFKVWSVLEVSPEPGPAQPEGSAIYHVTHFRVFESQDPEPLREQIQDRFYGTLRTVNPATGSYGKNQLARGGLIEINRCYVGGATNGIETGEVHRSVAPTRNFRFEYEPPADESREIGKNQDVS